MFLIGLLLLHSNINAWREEEREKKLSFSTNTRESGKKKRENQQTIFKKDDYE